MVLANVVDAKIDFLPNMMNVTPPISATLIITGNTAINTPNYGAVNFVANVPDYNMTLIAGPQVSLQAGGGFGGIWVRQEDSGDIAITSAATVSVTGSGVDGVTGTTNNGFVYLNNSGSVTSAMARGLYADGGFSNLSTDPVVVAIINSGAVHSFLAGIRSINYQGLSSIDNSGHVESATRQGLVAWSANGPVSITNTGTALAHDDNALHAQSEIGDIAVVNAGSAFAANDPNITDSGIGHSGIRTFVATSGNTYITNTASGTVAAADDFGIIAETPLGNVEIRNQGSVSALAGIHGSSAGGAVQVWNSGTVTAASTGVHLDGVENGLDNSGVIATASLADFAVLAGDGDTTIVNSGTIENTAASGVAIQLGAGSDRVVLTDTARTTGLVLAEGGHNTLELARADAGTFDVGLVGDAAQFRGFDTIEKTGPGTLTLVGDNLAFAGNTDVIGGTLAVNGVLGGTLAVRGGATLAGTGIVGTTSIASGGTLSPAAGGAIGTFSVRGDLSLASGSTYLVDINSAGHGDLVDVSGTATIGSGAGLAVLADGGWSLSTRYTLLTAAGGVNGTLAPPTSTFAFLTPVVSYDANNVYLNLERNGVSFATAATTRNQIAVAGALDTLTGGALYNAVAQLDAATAAAAFDQLSGEIHASAHGALVDDSRFVRDAANDRLRAALDGVAVPAAPAAGDGLALWTQGYGAWGEADSDGNAARLSHDIGGVLAGLDAPVFDTWRVGLLAGYSRSSFDVDDRNASGDADNYDLGVYGGTRWDNIGLRLGAAYRWSDVSVARGVSFTGFSDSLSANYDAGTAQAFGELGYRIDAGATPVGQVRFEPFAGLAYVNVHTDGFNEHGGAAALAAQSGDTGVTFSTIGVRASDTLAVNGVDLTASGTLGWRHAWGDVTPISAFAFSGSGAFTVAGVPVARNAAIVEADLSAAIADNVSLRASYTGQFGDGVRSQGVRGNLSIEF